jgi:predicted dehydrogenase
MSLDDTATGRTAPLGRRLRLGMVGGGQGGFIGAVHRIAARLDDRFELVAGALSSDPGRARASAERLFIAPERAYASFAAMAEAEAGRADPIDVVSIVTPNHLHHPAARAFLDAGIHVICDKPMTVSVAEAQELVAQVERTGLLFALTHTYSGYPMVRQAREMVEAGELGAIRVVQVEYPQGWLATAIEDQGQKQAAWRTDPAQSGQGGCIGDIGTHAAHLAEFVSGERIEGVLAALSTFVPGRRLDDDAQLLLRFSGGAKGMLWASQVAHGHANGLRLRIYGEKMGLAFEQEEPEKLRILQEGRPVRTLIRGHPEAGPAAMRATRTPAGHPEGFLEAFAQLYADAAEQITARLESRPPDQGALLLPTVQDGLRGMRFITAAIQSSRRGNVWVDPASCTS